MRCGDLQVIDPLLTIGISAFILWHVAGDLRLRILMLGAPAGPAPDAVAAHLAAQPGVEGCIICISSSLTRDARSCRRIW